MTNNRAIGVRKSNLGAGTTLSDNATLDYVENNINKKITYSNFLSNLGVSGSIIQTGKSTGTPILNKAGTVNKIRNLTAGTGISLTLDEFNSVKISNTAEPANVTKVNTEADLPAAVAGVITLAGNTNYVIGSSFTTSNRFAVSDNTSIIGSSRSYPIITYSGTGSMFTGNDIRFTIRDIGIIAASAAQVFNIDGTNLATSFAHVENVDCVDIENFGTFTALNRLDVINVTCQNCNGDGIVVAGTLNWDLFNVDGMVIKEMPNSSTAIGFGSSLLKSIVIKNCFFKKASGTSTNNFGIGGVALSANIAANGQAVVENNYFDLVSSLTSSIDINDLRWIFKNNNSIPNTRRKAFVKTTSSATTTITTVNTPVIMNNTFSTSIASKNFTQTGAGRITYVGETTRFFRVSLTASISPASGTAKLLAARIGKGGVAVDIPMPSMTDTAVPIVVHTTLETSMANGNYIEPFVENKTDAVDIDVDFCVLEITD